MKSNPHQIFKTKNKVKVLLQRKSSGLEKIHTLRSTKEKKGFILMISFQETHKKIDNNLIEEKVNYKSLALKVLNPLSKKEKIQVHQ